MAIRIAILGTGWGTRVQLPCFRAAGLEVSAIWARRSEAAREATLRHGIPYISTDWKQLLEEAEVDLVSVVAPPNLHREMTLAAVASGKHVLCEKPTALDAEEAAEMAEAAEAHPDLWCLIDHELRFLPSRRTFQRAVRDGFLGEIFHAEGTFLSDFRLDPEGPWNWWSDRDLGGGLLGALGSHLVDSLTWLLGRPVEAVLAQEKTAFPERLDVAGHLRPVSADDYAALQLRFEGAIPAQVQLSAVYAGPPGHRLAISGSEATLVWEDGQLTAFRRGSSEPEVLAVDPPTALPHGVPNQPFARGTMYLGGALRQALQDGDSAALDPAAGFRDGLAVQRVLDAARQSLETGAWVEIP